MAQLSRTLALPKDPDSVPSTHVVALKHPQLQLENGTPSSGLHGHFMHLVDIHTCSQNTYINKSNLFNKIE